MNDKCTSEVFRINKDGGHAYGYAIWTGLNKLHESEPLFTRDIAEIIGRNAAEALNNLKLNEFKS